MHALSSKLSFFFNKDNLPPPLTAICKADYPPCSFFLLVINCSLSKKKKKKNTQILKYETFSTLGLKVENGENIPKAESYIKSKHRVTEIQ